MIKTCLKTIFVVAFVFIFSSYAYAGSGVLTNIGSMDASAGYSEWWYTVVNPNLSGVASGDAEVNITIDGETNTVTADSDGNWSYSPTTLTEGDHDVTIESGGDTYTFALHAGQALPSDTGTGESTESETVPSTGFSQVLWIVAGLSLVSLGYSMNARRAALRTFEKEITKE